LPVGAGRKGETRRLVLQVMRPAGACLDAAESLDQVLEKAGQTTERTWPVCNPSGVIGVVTLEQLHKARQGSDAKTKVSDLLVEHEFPHLHTDHSLELALDRMGATHTDLLPVVSRANVHELLGVLRLRDVLKSYGVADGQES